MPKHGDAEGNTVLQIGLDPILVNLGPLPVGWHGLLTAIAVLAAILILDRQLRLARLVQVDLIELVLWVAPAGIVGARLAHVVDLWSFYSVHPLSILAVNEGGLSIYGGIIGCLVGGIAYIRFRHLPLWTMLDAVVPAALIGQSIGRVGCLINGDALGAPTNLPWAVAYTNPAASVPPNLLGVGTHPYPLYEIIWNMALLVILWRVGRAHLPQGITLCLYGVGYALGRIALSFVRQETVVVWNLQQAQVIGAILLAVFLLALLSRFFQAPRLGASKERPI
jgi:phosphatidylglycerol:prolipoprotein diacylglycerol transferase